MFREFPPVVGQANGCKSWDLKFQSWFYFQNFPQLWDKPMAVNCETCKFQSWFCLENFLKLFFVWAPFCLHISGSLNLNWCLVLLQTQFFGWNFSNITCLFCFFLWLFVTTLLFCNRLTSLIFSSHVIMICQFIISFSRTGSCCGNGYNNCCS